VLGEDLDSFPPLASLDRDTQLQGKAANVDATIPRWERLSQEYPEMPAPTTILKSRPHSVLPEVEAKLEEIRKRILIVCVDGYPLRALGCGIDGIETDGDFACEMATDRVEGQAQSLAGSSVLGTVVIMPGALWAGLVGLESVSPAIHEEVKVVRYQTSRRLQTKVPHTVLREVKWAPQMHTDW
jgi:hypothetical protein